MARPLADVPWFNDISMKKSGPTPMPSPAEPANLSGPAVAPAPLRRTFPTIAKPYRNTVTVSRIFFLSRTRSTAAAHPRTSNRPTQKFIVAPPAESRR
jgi:hypothetical protein